MAFRLDSHLYGEEKCGDAGLKFEMPCLEIRRDARKICNTKPIEVRARIVGSGKCLVLSAHGDE